MISDNGLLSGHPVYAILQKVTDARAASNI